jgi:hypothetical protein
VDAVQHTISDTTTERELWEKAVAQSKKGHYVHAAAWRGLAWCCFEQGDLDRARLAVQRSLEARPPVDDIVRLERLEILFSWFDYELRENPTELGYLASVLDQVDAELRDVTHADWRLEGSERSRPSGLRGPVDPRSKPGIARVAGPSAVLRRQGSHRAEQEPQGRCGRFADLVD